MQLKNASVLLAGGAGFLGTNMALRLLSEGVGRLWIVDNFQTGRHSNLAQLAVDARVQVVEHDIIEPLPAALQSQSMDLILNLACAASPPHYQADPVHTFRTSIWGNWNLAQYALAQRARLLFTSTSEVYGDPEMHPQSESYRGAVNVNGIRACYDEGKRGGETLLCDLARKQKLEVRIARIFNTYGPWMDPADGRVVSNFIVQALQGQALTMYGDGSQTRSFCYVDDMVEGLLRLALSGPELNALPVNLGNESEFTLLQLVHELERSMGHNLPLEYRSLPADDPRKRRPDLSRARTMLGWEPQVSLAQGLGPTIEYFRRESLAH